MKAFKRLRQKLDYLPSDQIDQIRHAYLIAADAHSEQKRHSGEPYITHPLAVSCILADMRMDGQTIMAALLHDVIEDTAVTKEFIQREMGSVVAELVDGVSKLTQIEFKSRAEIQAENFRKMILAMSRDIRVMIIKLADRLHNMRTLGPLNLHKRRRIARETLDIFAPIAQRLGMHIVATELEDLGFKTLYPLRYRIILDAVRKARGGVKKVLNGIAKELKEALINNNLGHCTVLSREKHLYSIYRKMRVRGLSFEEILDVYGFRVITKTSDECYRILGIVHQLFKPLPEKFKDYIAIPKANGYQSLHTTLFGPQGVPIEVQIRTHEMDIMANSGVAAHWLYKSEDETTDESRLRAQQWIRNLLEMQQKAGNSLEFIESVKIDLFPDEVYVFTPKGAIMELPVGATAVDFAYAVHTDIGNSCVAVKVDRQLAPLSTVLSSGQTIEVITSPNSRPNPTWLNFVVTARARSGIRHYLKTQRRAESITLGKQLLNKALISLSLSIKKIPQQRMYEFLRELNIDHFDDLLESIGLGDRVAMIVAYQLAGEFQRSEYEKEPSTVKPLLIKGTEGMVIHFATCCYPIPGDPIVGILKAGQGIVIHTEECKRVGRLQKYPERYMTVSWAGDLANDFLAAVRIDGLNQRGVLAKLAHAVASADANIDDIQINERDSRHYAVTLKLHVQNRVQLAKVIRNLRHIKSVIKVTRVKGNVISK